MNIDELKNSFRQISYKEDDETIDFTRRVESIVERVREKDRNERVKYIFSIIVLSFGAISFATKEWNLFFNNPNYTPDLIRTICILTTIVGVFSFGYHLLKMRRVKYDQPIVQFIESTEKRYNPFLRNPIWSILFFLVIFALTVLISARFDFDNIGSALITLLPLLALCALLSVVNAAIVRRKMSTILKELQSIKESMK